LKRPITALEWSLRWGKKIVVLEKELARPETESLTCEFDPLAFTNHLYIKWEERTGI
jgi:hypothetical protein